MSSPRPSYDAGFIDELLFLGSSHEIGSRLDGLDSGGIEDLARTLEAKTSALRADGRKAEAELHERVAAIVRGHLEEAATNVVIAPVDRLTPEGYPRSDPAPRIDQTLQDAAKPPGVFISYSRRDQAYVDELEAHLQAAGVPVWLDRQRLPAGARITKEIRDAIASCPVFLLVLSSASIKSDWVDDEDAWARVHKRMRIALRLDPGAQWFSVAGLNIVDVTDRSMPPDDVIETLRAAVREQSGAEAERWGRLEEAARWIDAGIAAQEIRDIDGAEREYRRALERYEAYGFTAGIASAYHQLGIVAGLRNDLDGALEHYHRSLEMLQILRDEGADCELDAGYAQIGQVLAQKGDHEGALQNMTMALQLRRKAGNTLGEANSLHDLARVYGGMVGKYFDLATGGIEGSPEALELHKRATDCEREALRLFTAHQDREGLAMTTDGLGRLAWMVQNLDDAESYLTESLNIKEVLGWREGIGNSLVALAHVKLERSRLDQAVPMLLRSLAIRDALNLPTIKQNVDLLVVLQAKIGRPRLVRLAEREGLGHALATFDALLEQSR